MAVAQGARTPEDVPSLEASDSVHFSVVEVLSKPIHPTELIAESIS